MKSHEDLRDFYARLERERKQRRIVGLCFAGGFLFALLLRWLV